MVQSLASVTSGEVTSAVVREESHPAHLHPQILSVREEIGEELLYQPVMLSHWTQTGFFSPLLYLGSEFLAGFVSCLAKDPG